MKTIILKEVNFHQYGLPAKFIEVVETEILGRHEGKFVRYRIKSSEILAWKKRGDF